MIITCTSCLTKFHLDESRIGATGAKVRCSRCKHVFTFVPPPETKEEINKDLESFAKYHEELMESEKEEASPVPQEQEKEIAPEMDRLLKMEEAPVFPEEGTLPGGEAERILLDEKEREKHPPLEPVRIARREKRGLSVFFRVVIVILLLTVGAYYLWTELRSGGRLAPYVGSPVRQIRNLWEQLWGTEKGGLTVRDLNGYEEKTTGADFFVIEGRVHNQSRFTKKFVKVRVVIFDQNRAEIVEKEVICGRVLGRGELKRLSRELLEAAILKPPPEEDMVLPPGKTTLFMVIFRDLPSRAKEFEVEIVAAPNA